jgi:dTDP-4-amino-4,6-dideoxygalactose transaminase
MSNICAGIGRGQMEVIDTRVSQRRAMHSFYQEIFEENSVVTVFNEPSNDYFSNHWLSAIVLASYEQREALRVALEVCNIESRPLWKPMHLQPIFEKYPYYGTKVSETLFEKGLCMPSGSNLSNEERSRIATVINDFFRA